MSKYTNCALYVDGNGKYCCRTKVFTVSKYPVVVTNANCDPVELIVYPTGDTDETAVPSGIIAAPGATIVATPGKYLLPCPEGLDGTVAPVDVTAQKALCCCEIRTSLDAMMLEKLCAIADATGPTDITAIVEKLCALLEGPDGSAIEKLCEIAVNTGVDGILCKKLAAILSNDEKWCAADAVFQAALLACMEVLKANTAAITGIETSLGQIGCTEDEEGNITGSVLVCKHTDTTTDPATDTIKVWWFGLDGTVVEDYVGVYVACTNLQALANLLEQILNCPKPVTMECVQKFTRCIGYDNGWTPGASTNDGGKKTGLVHKDDAYIVKGWMVNGAEVGAGDVIPAGGAGGAGWTAQLQAWADFFNANMPADSKCIAEFGFLPAPTWRYAKITCNDPNTTFGPWRIEDEDGVCFTVYPILESLTVEQRYRYSTVDCDGNKATVWCNEKGETVPAPEDPECWYPCDVVPASMVEGNTPDCGNPKIQKVCDKTKNGEIPFYLMTYDCDGEEVISYFTVESWDAGNPEPYEVQGVIVNCLTGEPLKNDGISWSLCYGYYVDAEGNNQETVWTIGVDACGNILFPNGSECPIYLQGGTGGDAELPQCTCTGSCSARQLVGFGSLEYTTTGAGSNTHGIQFDAAANAGLENVLANTVTNANSSDWSICTVSPAPGVSFTYSQGTLVRNGPGDYSSTAPVPENNCQLELLSQEWNRHEDGTAEGNTGYSIRCCGTKANNCVVPGEGDIKQCLQILDPQPTNVIKGPMPENSELLCLKEIKLQNTQIITELLNSNEMASDALVKQCLLDDFWMNCAPESPLAQTLDKESGELCLEGNVVATYTAGKTIALKDADGNICGNATVITPEDGEPTATYNEDTKKTTVFIEECELAEGKTPQQIKTAKPVLVATVKAVVASVKQVSILQAKAIVRSKATIGKKETTRG